MLFVQCDLWLWTKKKKKKEITDRWTNQLLVYLFLTWTDKKKKVIPLFLNILKNEVHPSQIVSSSAATVQN